MNIPFVDLKIQYARIKNEIDFAMQGVIASTAFIGGKYCKQFEEEFAQYIGAYHCIGVGNGTDALYIALKSLGVSKGDEVITAANSFIATSEAITLAGAKVVFVDCDKETYNMDVSKIEQFVTEKTRAIIPVHLYGQPVKMDLVWEIAKKHNLYIIEDAAQAHGAKYKNKNVGTLGDIACFSFFPGKNLGAYGDGGAIVTNNSDMAKKARMFANHGRIEKYNHEVEGTNSRLDGLQAAILSVKLKYLEDWTSRRNSVAKSYNLGLQGDVVIPTCMDDVRHAYHLYVVRVKKRAEIQKLLLEKGISTGVHYPIPLPFLKAYEHLGYEPEDFPVAHQYKDELLSLPIHGDMDDEQVKYVIDTFNEIIRNC